MNMVETANYPSKFDSERGFSLNYLSLSMASVAVSQFYELLEHKNFRPIRSLNSLPQFGALANFQKCKFPKTDYAHLISYQNMMVT